MSDEYQVREDIDNIRKDISDNVYSKDEIDEKLATEGADLSNYALEGHTHTYKDLDDLPIIPTDLGALVEWDTPNYNSTYVNTSSTGNHIRIARLGNLATLDYYLALNNAITSSNCLVVDNIPSDFQPKDSFNELTVNINGVVYLFSIVDNKIYLRHYSTGTQGGAVSGMLSYITKTVTQEVGSVELSTSSSELWLDKGDTAILTATVLDDEDNPIADAEVLFYEGETTIGSDTTDENGVATIEYIPSVVGDYSLTAVCDDVSSESVSVSVKDNSATTVSVSVSSSTAYVGDTVNVTITATDIEDNPSVGKNVIYNSATIGTTDSNGEYSTSITFDSSGTKTLTYTVDGVTGSATITVSKISTTTTLSSSSSSVTVGSSITLTGAVSVNVANLSIGICQGNTLLDTVYTDSNGGFTKTLTMATTGTISLSAIFTGNDTYATSTSNTVTVTVSKKTPTLTITGGGTYYQGTTNYIVGSLTDNATPIINATIELWEANGSSAITSTTTLSDGSYSFIIPSSTLGNFEYYVDYNGDSTYDSATSSSIYVSIIPVSTVGSIDLVSDKSILSYADSDTATLTATVYDDSSPALPLEGETVYFKIGDQVIGSDVTDSNGEATCVMDSYGDGDVVVTAECSNVSDSLTIEDCIIYDPLTSNSGKWTIPSGCPTSYDSNGCKFGTPSSYVQIRLTEKLTAPCSVEATIVDYYSQYNDSPSVIFYQYTNGETTPNQILLIGGYSTLNSINALGTTINHAIIKGAKYRVEYGSSTMKVYENNTQLASASNTVGLPTKFEFHVGSSGRRWIKLKDIKVKPV